MQVDLIAITRHLRGDGSAESLVEHAGRVCYRSEGSGNTAAFLRARLKAGHESIIEHASATFEISGISRACSHQLVRHRLASYSQESQRYVDMSDPSVVIPDAITDRPEALAVWSRFMEQVKETYQDLRALGVRKEDARFALPNATATRIVVTMNFRELRHFFRLRITPEAQWEIRQMALEMLEQVLPYAPTIFGDSLAEIQALYPELVEGGSTGEG
ncbi:MAG: FAD-dependent thymidylate synthase [Anaerolineae bacterium]|nr:FAD-dependent thymidylate synthase [Anaerolineae bacterium]